MFNCKHNNLKSFKGENENRPKMSASLHSHSPGGSTELLEGRTQTKLRKLKH